MTVIDDSVADDWTCWWHKEVVMSRYWTHTLSYADLYLQGGQKLFLKFLTTMY